MNSFERLVSAFAVVLVILAIGFAAGAWAERRATCNKAIDAQRRYFESHASLAEWQMARPVVTVAGPEVYTPAEPTTAKPTTNGEVPK